MSSSYLRGLNMAAFFTANKIILFVTFTVYVLVGNKISASRVFVAVSLYSAIRLTVTLFFPAAIEKVSESAISIRRIKVRPPSLGHIYTISDWIRFFYDHLNLRLHYTTMKQPKVDILTW